MFSWFLKVLEFCDWQHFRTLVVTPCGRLGTVHPILGCGFIAWSVLIDDLFFRFLLQVVGVIVEKIKIGTTVLTTDPNSYDFICQQLARLLLYITHMFQSGENQNIFASSIF